MDNERADICGAGYGNGKWKMIIGMCKDSNKIEVSQEVGKFNIDVTV